MADITYDTPTVIFKPADSDEALTLISRFRSARRIRRSNPEFPVAFVRPDARSPAVA